MSYGPLITDMDRKVLKQNVTHWKQIQKEQLEKEKNKQRWEDIKTRTRLWMHSDAEMVGTFASSVHAKKLVVTHFSSRYDTSENLERKMCFLIAEQVKEYYQACRRCCGWTLLHSVLCLLKKHSIPLPLTPE